MQLLPPGLTIRALGAGAGAPALSPRPGFEPFRSRAAWAHALLAQV